MNDEFTGYQLREFREKNKLSREALARLLKVSAVTVEKWEQNGERAIRPIYHSSLAAIGAMGAGAGVAGIAVGLLAAPAAITGFAGLAGLSALTGGAGALLNNSKDVEKLTIFLEKYNKLTDEEKDSYIRILKKFNEE